MGREARTGRRESFDCGEGPLGEAQPLGEVCRRGQVGVEPIPEPSDAGKGGEDLAIQAYRGRGGGTVRVSLERSPPVDEFGLGDTETYLPGHSTGFDSPIASLQGSDVRPI